MNPSTGQFLSKDSYEGDTSNPITLHKYLYAHANPVTYEDPSGYFAISKTTAFVGVAAILSINTGSSVPVLKIAQSVAMNVAVNALFYQRLMDIVDGVSIGVDLGSIYDEAIRSAESGGEVRDGNSDSEKKGKVGKDGVKIPGSKTTGQNGKTERVDIENPNPGKGDGNVHYHEPNNTKWEYDIKTGKILDPDTGKMAPPRVQRVTKEPWFQKAIEKALKYLGERK